MRRLGERCRTDDDWQSLLGVLLQISLSDRPPPLDREPIYRWSVGRLPSSGLRASRPRRRRAGEGASSADRAERQANLTGDRKAKRARLRAVLDGADSRPNELANLSRWVLDDAEAADARRGEERELLAEEMMAAMRKLIGAANACKKEADQLRRDAMKAKAAAENPEMEEGVAQDVLRAAAGGGAGATAGDLQEAVAGEGAAPGGAPAAEGGKKVEPKAAGLQKVDAAADSADLNALSELLRSDHEDVAMKAALATAAVCARDTDLQQQLADVGGLPRIVALLDGGFSQRAMLDLTLCLKALTANRMHHPALLTQFVQAGGPKKLVRLASGADSEVAHAALQIVRSLADAKAVRKALVNENVLPPLLRCLRPTMPAAAVEPAAAAIAVLTRHESECCSALLSAQGTPSLVQLLGRGADSLAAHSAASSIACLATDESVGVEAQKRARDAGALEALLPLLDGVLAGNGSQAATAEAACSALAELCRGSSAIASELRTLGALQTMVGLLSAPTAPPALRVSACDAIGAAAASDSVACDELRRLGAVPLLAKLVTGGTKSVAEQAQSVLSLLQQRGDEAMESEVASAMAEASSEGAPNLVAQLQQGNKLARRAALLLDSLALDSPAARAQIVKLGAVPRLVKLVRRGASDMGALNALGTLEVLSQGAVSVQDEAREAGIFPALVPLIKPHDPMSAAPAPAPEAGGGEEGREGAGAPPDAYEMRTNAALCLCALVGGNKVSREAAKKAGAVEALATLLDGDSEERGAYLAAMGMHALGLDTPAAQEKAVAPLQAAAAAKSPEEAPAPTGRLGALRQVWQLKAEPERWRRS